MTPDNQILILTSHIEKNKKKRPKSVKISLTEYKKEKFKFLQKSTSKISSQKSQPKQRTLSSLYSLLI